MPESFGKLKNIQFIEFQNNEISFLGLGFFGLKSLINVNMGYNQIQVLEANLFLNNVNLKVLNAESNQLTKLPAEIGKAKKLNSLILSFNKLEQLPDEICNLQNLEMLLLTGIKLTTLPQNISKLTKLKTLIAKDNNFSEAEKTRIKKALKSCDVIL